MMTPYIFSFSNFNIRHNFLIFFKIFKISNFLNTFNYFNFSASLKIFSGLNFMRQSVVLNYISNFALSNINFFKKKKKKKSLSSFSRCYNGSLQ